MWQRIQTLYLGIATILVAALFWSDVARIALPDGGIENVRYTSRTIYLVWVILLTVLQVLCLGGYKWRMKQLRMTIVTAIMCLGFQGWLAYDYFRLQDEMTFSFTILFPAAASILDFIASRNIFLDEAIVQSANRLRSSRKTKKQK